MGEILNKSRLTLLKVLSNNTIINILIVGLISVFVKGLAFFKETIVAGSFGLSILLDTFYIAVLIPSFINNVFVESLSNIFIPNYIAELKNSTNKGAFQSVSFIIVTIIAALFCLISILFTDTLLPVLYKGHTVKYYHLILVQFYCIVPALFFWGYSSLISALLVVGNKFSQTSLYPIFTTCSVIICVFFFKNQLGVLVLGVGILIGSALEFLFLLSCALYYREICLSRPSINANVKLMVGQLPAKISSGFFIGMNPFVDQYFAAQLLLGSITAMNYGIKIPSFISSILILALGSVLLPFFSKLVNTDRTKAYKELFKILMITFISTSLISLLMLIFSTDIIYWVFQRGKFSSSDTVVVSNIQKIFLIYIPFFTCGIVLVKFLTSINKNKFMAVVSLLSLFLNFIFNVILMKSYHLYGLAMSTTLVYIINCLVLLIYTWKQQKNEIY